MLGWFLAWITLRHTAVPAVGRRKQRFTREVLGNRPAMLLIWGYTCHTSELLGMWCLDAGVPGGLPRADRLNGGQCRRLRGLITASFHFVGLLASFSMGTLSDRMNRARILLVLAAASIGLLLPVRLVRRVALGAGGGNRPGLCLHGPGGLAHPVGRPHREGRRRFTWRRPRFKIAGGVRRRGGGAVAFGAVLTRPSHDPWAESLRRLGLGLQRARLGRGRGGLGRPSVRSQSEMIACRFGHSDLFRISDFVLRIYYPACHLKLKLSPFSRESRS